MATWDRYFDLMDDVLADLVRLQADLGQFDSTAEESIRCRLAVADSLLSELERESQPGEPVFK